MPTGDVNSKIRSHSRKHCEVAAELRIDDRDASAVVVASAQLTASGAIAVTVFDVSEGGLGLRTNVFLPKGCSVAVKVKCPQKGEGGVFERLAEVKRITMIDATPTYELGVAFAGECTGDAGMDHLVAWAAASPTEANNTTARNAAA